MIKEFDRIEISATYTGLGKWLPGIAIEINGSYITILLDEINNQGMTRISADKRWFRRIDKNSTILH